VLRDREIGVDRSSKNVLSLAAAPRSRLGQIARGCPIVHVMLAKWAKLRGGVLLTRDFC